MMMMMMMMISFPIADTFVVVQNSSTSDLVHQRHGCRSRRRNRRKREEAMVEGPGVHRVALVHRRMLQGRVFQATSPSGRFVDGAAAINGRVLSHIEAHGKNIFYFFTAKKVKEEEGVLEKLGLDAVVVHIHFGMSGSFHTFPYPGPEPREATRLQLENKKEGLVAHLSATLCVHGDLELYRSRIAKLGPDPLRQDADKEVVWLSMQKTKQSIGAFLMDQSMIAGIGNIYRSELLLVTGIHPDHCASTVSRSSFESLWIQAKQLMEIGVQTGYIITILTDDTGHALPKKSRGKSHYVYNQKTCGRCHGVIQTWKIAQRTVYACEACQPLPPTISQSVTVKRRRAASICSTRLGGRDDTLDTEDTSVEDNVGMTVTTSKKRVAKGGRVVEHQAFKHISTGGLPDAFEIPGLSAAADREDTEDSQNHVPEETTAAQMGRIVMTALSHGNPCKFQTRQGEDADSNNQDKEQEALESNLVVSKVTVERQQEHRSTRLQKKVEATNERITLGFRARKKRNT